MMTMRKIRLFSSWFWMYGRNVVANSRPRQPMMARLVENPSSPSKRKATKIVAAVIGGNVR